MLGDRGKNTLGAVGEVYECQNLCDKKSYQNIRTSGTHLYKQRELCIRESAQDPAVTTCNLKCEWA